MFRRPNASDYQQKRVLDSAQMFCKTRKSITKGVLRFGAILLCAAGVQSQTPQSVNPGTVFPSATQTNAAKPPATATAAGDSNVRLGVGDLVELSVYDVPELNAKTRVSSQGELYLPLIDYVQVDGLTIEAAERVIERRLEQGGFVRSPHVQLFVDEYASDGASVLGEVAKPGVYPVLGQQKLFDVISAAGGLTDRAGKIVTISHRSGAEKPTIVTLSHNLEDHPESNIPIFAGDTIMVRRADVIYVVGDVARPSGFLMDNDGHLSVLQAIALAGGTTGTAKTGGTRIIRRGPAGLTEIPVPLKKLFEAKTGDIPLEADDILFVPTSARKAVSARTAEAAAQLATGVGLVAIRP